MNELSRSHSKSKSKGRRLPSYLDLIEDDLRHRGGSGSGGGLHGNMIAVKSLKNVTYVT